MDGRDLKALRQRRGVDLFTLAERIGLDAMTLAAVESNQITATEDTMREIEAAILALPRRREIGWWGWAALVMFALGLAALAAMMGR